MSDKPDRPAIEFLMDRYVGNDPAKLASYAEAKREADDLQRVYDAMEAVVGGDAAMRWLEQPNPAFGGRSVDEAVADGDTDRVLALIDELRRDANRGGN